MSNSDYVVSNEKVIGEQWIWKDLKKAAVA
jgi:hypothetical protein